MVTYLPGSQGKVKALRSHTQTRRKHHGKRAGTVEAGERDEPTLKIMPVYVGNPVFCHTSRVFGTSSRTANEAYIFLERTGGQVGSADVAGGSRKRAGEAGDANAQKRKQRKCPRTPGVGSQQTAALIGVSFSLIESKLYVDLTHS